MPETSSSESRGPGRPRSKEVHQAILRATVELLEEQRFDELTYTQIAERAGVGRPSLYRRWDSKEALIREALEQFRPEFEPPDTGAFYTDLQALLGIVAMLKASPAARNAIAMALNAGAEPDPSRDPHWRTYILPRGKIIDTVFRRAMERGELQSDLNVERAMDMLAGTWMYLIFVKPDWPDDDELATLIDLYHRAVTA